MTNEALLAAEVDRLRSTLPRAGVDRDDLINEVWVRWLTKGAPAGPGAWRRVLIRRAVVDAVRCLGYFGRTAASARQRIWKGVPLEHLEALLAGRGDEGAQRTAARRTAPSALRTTAVETDPWLWTQVCALPRKHRQAVLDFACGAPVADTARTLGIPVRQAEYYRQNGLRRLQRRLHATGA